MTVKIKVNSGIFVSEDRSYYAGEIAEVSDGYYESNKKALGFHQYYGAITILNKEESQKEEVVLANAPPQREVDFDKFKEKTVKQLKQIAKENNVGLPFRAKEDEIINALLDANIKPE